MTRAELEAAIWRAMRAHRATIHDPAAFADMILEAADAYAGREPVKRRRRGPGRPWEEWELRPHGTLAAYRRHSRHGEKPCESCRQAQARYNADRRPREAS